MKLRDRIARPPSGRGPGNWRRIDWQAPRQPLACSRYAALLPNQRHPTDLICSRHTPTRATKVRTLFVWQWLLSFKPLSCEFIPFISPPSPLSSSIQGPLLSEPWKKNRAWPKFNDPEGHIRRPDVGTRRCSLPPIAARRPKTQALDAVWTCPYIWLDDFV